MSNLTNSDTESGAAGAPFCSPWRSRRRGGAARDGGLASEPNERKELKVEREKRFETGQPVVRFWHSRLPVRRRL